MLKNIKISAKMLLGFMSLIIFTAIIGMVSSINMGKTANLTDKTDLAEANQVEFYDLVSSSAAYTL